MAASYLVTTLRNHCKSISQIHQVHVQALINGLFSSPFLTYLLDAISLSASTNTFHLQYPIKIFNFIPNPSSFNYNTLIRILTLRSSPRTAFGFYVQMRRNSVAPDFHTYPFVLKACALFPEVSLPVIRGVHCELLKLGFEVDVFVTNALACGYCRGGDVGGAEKVFDGSLYRDVVSYNVMIDGFVKNGEVDRARKVFDEMPERDGYSWGSLLAGYAKMGRGVEAIELFDCMVGLGVRFDHVAILSALSACAQLGELEKGKKIVREVIEGNGIRVSAYLGTALVDMYAKCGDMEMARKAFESCSEKVVSVWNAMLVGLAMHGNARLLLEYFARMVDSGVKPDGFTILGVLVGCSHSGLVDEAVRIFTEMETVYNVKRELKHYGCMADLLSRAGLIKEAVKMIEEMPMGGDVFVWGGLLGGCKIHGNLEVAELAAKRLMEVKPEDGGVYSELVQMYANTQRWDDLVKMRRLRDCRWGIKKSAGCSLIELDGIKHEFVSGDSLHPCTEEIYFVLNRLELQRYI